VVGIRKYGIALPSSMRRTHHEACIWIADMRQERLKDKLSSQGELAPREGVKFLAGAASFGDTLYPWLLSIQAIHDGLIGIALIAAWRIWLSDTTCLLDLFYG
jgi:hypothetical protein